VRFGEKVYSPLIEEGKSDFILAFEKLEALRYIHYLKKTGQVIVDNREIPPMSVLVGQAKYPEDISRKLRKQGKAHFVDAANIALELGNIRVVNIILLGVLSTFLHFKETSWVKAISDNVKEKFVDLNSAAFKRGQQLVSQFTP
jgi:indolepyruvate ferredoxin oxidoreductase beta subunit